MKFFFLSRLKNVAKKGELPETLHLVNFKWDVGMKRKLFFVLIVLSFVLYSCTDTSEKCYLDSEYRLNPMSTCPENPKKITDQNLLMGVALAGNSGSSGTPGFINLDEPEEVPSVPYQLKVLSVASKETTVYTGQRNNFIVKISSQATAKNVPVNFLFAKKADIDNESSETLTQFFGDSVLIPKVDKGEKEYTIDVRMPNADENTGAYVVLAQVDPDKNGEKMYTSTSASPVTGICKADESCFGTVTLDDSFKNQRDLGIDLFSTSSDVYVLNEFTKPDTEILSGSLGITSIGMSTSTVPVHFYLTDTAGNAIPNVTLKVLNEATEVYESSLAFPEMTQNITQVFSYSISMDSASLTNLQTYITTQGNANFQLKAVVNETSSVAEISSPIYLANNTSTTALKIFYDSTTVVSRAGWQALEYSKNIGKQSGDKGQVASTANYSSTSRFDDSKAYAKTNLYVPVFFLGSAETPFFEAPIETRSVFGDKNQSGSVVNVKILGTLFLSYSALGSQIKSYYQFQKSIGQEYGKTIYIKGVPVFYRINIDLNAGFRIYTSNAIDGLDAKHEPYANLTAVPAGGLGIYNAIEVGIRGNINVAEWALVTSVKATLTKTSSKITGTLTHQLHEEIRLISGNIEFYGKIYAPLPVFCKTVVWEEEVPYICAWKYPEFAVNLFRFGPAVRIKSPFLLNQSGTVNLDLHECLNRSLTQCNEEF